MLDTDVVSNLMRPRPSGALTARLAATPDSEQSTTAITLGELSYGAQRAGRPELYARSLELLAGRRVIPFDEGAAERYGLIRDQLERAGTRLADPDLRIAAIVLARGATLVTGNLRHFQRITHLTVEDWLRG